MNEITTYNLINQTSTQYDLVIRACKQIFSTKNKDYGSSWRIMRLSSIIDQIYIKANRIRTIEQNGEMKIQEGMADEFKGIINYCIIGLIQIRLKDEAEINLSTDILNSFYQEEIDTTKSLMLDKNQDYGEAWRNMRISTFTDMILMRLLRIRQIEDNQGKTIASEGIDSNLRDIINYSVFALIRLNEKNENPDTDL